jgi:hypothetical protein
MRGMRCRGAVGLMNVGLLIGALDAAQRLISTPVFFITLQVCETFLEVINVELGTDHYI